MCLHCAVTQSVYTLQAQRLGCLLYDVTQSVYLLMPSEGRQSVYFLMAHVLLMQLLGVSTLCRDSDCLLCVVTLTHKEDKLSTL